MRFPPEFIDRLRNHLPISEVIGKRVPIKKHGREFQALCPFHKEKSPSFTVNDDKGFYHCFGCGAHGDAIGFVREFEGLSYPEAIERLAIEAGLPVPRMTREAEEQEKKRLTLEDVVKLAERWFAEQLRTPQGEVARTYLHDRGVSEAMVTHFGIGFAPNARDALKTALTKQGISEALLMEAGLLANPEEGPTYDRFRGRLIFPIRDARGKTVAFGGRILPPFETDRSAKYLNSPETPLFKKGEMLFALDQAKEGMREQKDVIVAEGYLDVIALHQAGFKTAVAPLGTAVTEMQLSLLWRLAPEPILCLDGDSAGLRAMLRAAELALPLIKPGISLRFAFLPSGQDPDDFLKTAGAHAMREVLAQSRILSEMLADYAYTHFGSDTAEKKASLEQYLMQSAGRIADPTVRNSYQSFFRERIYQANRWKNNKKTDSFAALPAASIPSLPQIHDDSAHLKRLEDQLMRLILLHPDLMHQADIEEHLGSMDFTQPSLDKLRAATLELCANQQSMDSAALCATLATHGHGEKVNTLLHSGNSSALPSSLGALIRDNPHAAKHAFAQMYGAYTMQKLEHEKREAERALGADMSEQNLERFLALSRQIETLRRTRYTTWPDEQVS